jgi:electron transfer flavoprotein alpha subunit
MRIFVIAEHNNQNVHAVTRHTLTAARAWSSEIIVLVLGHDCIRVAEEIATYQGVSKVLLADYPCYANRLAENSSIFIKKVAASADAIFAPATTFGKNLLPRVAALLGVTQVSDVIALITKDTVDHLIYAGNAVERVRILDEKKVLTIRSTAFLALTETQPSCPIETLENIVLEENTRFIKYESHSSARPPLATAKRVVSGGRGLQSKEQFALVEELADILGAAVGATRAAVDAGFVTNDCQVGQTGKVVAPDLYIALGISGAIQHIAGIKDAKVIVAINKDEDAPIFQIATYGLVGDVFVIVPKLIQLLKEK